MPKLTDSIGTFVTGDLVFTRYPPTSRQPIHVTLFLAPDAGHGQAYVHAGGTQLEIAAAPTYEEDSGAGGYLHAHPTETELRANTAEVAQIFAQTLTPTPYGSYPGTADFQRIGITPKSPHASRFTGMLRTEAFAEIPFEFPALHRLLKWTQRAIARAPFSEHRGITCAAFVAACHQVARMRAYFTETGVAFQPDKLKECLQFLAGVVESKASLRENLELLAKDPKTDKAIYRDQAYRENSNRKLTDAGAQKLRGLKNVTLTKKGWPANIDLTQLSDVEKYWLVIQTQFLGIHQSEVRLAEDILTTDFFFDAKYVNSPLLSRRVLEIKGWKTTAYKQY